MATDEMIKYLEENTKFLDNQNNPRTSPVKNAFFLLVCPVCKKAKKSQKGSKFQIPEEFLPHCECENDRNS